MVVSSSLLTLGRCSSGGGGGHGKIILKNTMKRILYNNRYNKHHGFFKQYYYNYHSIKNQYYFGNQALLYETTTTTTTLQYRFFSTTNGNNENENSDSTSTSSSTTKSNGGNNGSGPTKIRRTPRSQVSKRRKNIMEDNGQVSTTTSTTPVKRSDPFLSHMMVNSTHIIKGGLPCDPAPPPFELASYGEESLYTLVLLRHGESEWNSLNRYTGWCDVNLTKKGEREARDAGRLLHENGIELDHAFTSVLRRASFSCNMALNMAHQHWVPITKTWRLNERHYGALQGYNKDTAWEELNLDQELVMQMRRSYHVRPPRMEDDHPYWHGNDRRYRKLTPEQLDKSRAESLKDTADRIMPFFNSVIVPSIRSGNKCIVVSHANTIRTLIKQIDGISDEDIKGMSIPTGIPLLYRLDKDLKPVDPVRELEFRYMVEPKGYTWGTDIEHGFHGVYLGDLERLQEIQRKRDATNRDWQRIILRNIAKSLDPPEATATTTTTLATRSKSLLHSLPKSASCNSSIAYETRQLWWQIHNKCEHPDYRNMLLLAKMKQELETRMYHRKQKYLSAIKYNELVDQLHLDSEGHVVDPFVALSERQDREERQRMYYESLAQDLEEECLIK